MKYLSVLNLKYILKNYQKERFLKRYVVKYIIEYNFKMGWFSKKKQQGRTEEYEEDEELPQLPELPDLPQLPELPEIDIEQNEMPQLPRINYNSQILKDTPPKKIGSFRSSSSNKFAQEIEENHDEMQMMQKPLRSISQIKSLPKLKEIELPKIKEAPREEFSQEIPYEFKEAAKKVKNSEPVFIRIDRFQKALDILEETKDQIADMRKNLMDIKQIKDEEEAELNLWESEINKLKAKVDKIDTDLFSKVD